MARFVQEQTRPSERGRGATREAKCEMTEELKSQPSDMNPPQIARDEITAEDYRFPNGKQTGAHGLNSKMNFRYFRYVSGWLQRYVEEGPIVGFIAIPLGELGACKEAPKFDLLRGGGEPRRELLQNERSLDHFKVYSPLELWLISAKLRRTRVASCMEGSAEPTA